MGNTILGIKIPNINYSAKLSGVFPSPGHPKILKGEKWSLILLQINSELSVYCRQSQHHSLLQLKHYTLLRTGSVFSVIDPHIGHELGKFKHKNCFCTSFSGITESSSSISKDS